MGACALCAFLYQVLHIAPYMPFCDLPSPSAEASHPEREFSILIANVKAENNQYSRVERLIETCDPDIVLLLETGHAWRDGMESSIAKYPVRLIEPLDNYYGMIFLTRLETTERKILHPVRHDIPAMEASFRLKSGFEFDFYGLHPIPPMPDQSSRERDTELKIVAAKVGERGRPAIVGGDLNDVAWSHTTQKFLETSGMVDPRVGRGLYATFHADYRFARWPLDHVFYSRDFRLIAMKVMPHIGSDHFPIFVRLQAPR